MLRKANFQRGHSLQNWNHLSSQQVKTLDYRESNHDGLGHHSDPCVLRPVPG